MPKQHVTKRKFHFESCIFSYKHINPLLNIWREVFSTTDSSAVTKVRKKFTMHLTKFDERTYRNKYCSDCPDFLYLLAYTYQTPDILINLIIQAATLKQKINYISDLHQNWLPALIYTVYKLLITFYKFYAFQHDTKINDHIYTATSS